MFKYPLAVTIDTRDMDREALGFQALGSYESYLEDNLPDSHFYADITARFEEINGLYRKYDDCCISFDDLLAELNTAYPKEIIKLELIGISFWFFCSTGIISASRMHLYLAFLFHRDYFGRLDSSPSYSFVP